MKVDLLPGELSRSQTIETKTRRNLYGFVLLSGLIHHAAAAEGYNLATTDQTRIEAVALQVLDTAEVRQARQQVEELFRRNPVAATPSGRVTLEEAVDETVFAAVVDMVADDPANPTIVWTLNAPHQWHGLQVPGSRYGIDNPDNIYRLAFIDGVSRYEIKAHVASNKPAQYVFELLDSAPGINGSGRQLGILKDKDLNVAPDGSFTITFDPEPANGRPNHIQTKPEAKVILIRDTLGDWSHQTPNALKIHRLSPTQESETPDIHQLAIKASEAVPNFATYWLDFRDHTLFQKLYHHQINALTKIDPRQGGWGYAGGGRFKLAPDEALIIKVSPKGAQYIGFQLTDPWMISTDYIHRSGSLNNHQAVANTDGSYTYVVAAQNPGVANWLDTGGIDEGYFQLRWQQLPAGVEGLNDAVREARLVKISDLGEAISDMSKNPSVKNPQDNGARLASYALRLE